MLRSAIEAKEASAIPLGARDSKGRFRQTSISLARPSEAFLEHHDAMQLAVILANLTGQGSKDGLLYGAAADSQVRWLLNNVSRTSEDGAISHRPDQLQLWADFIYMVPPFLAYYGVATGDFQMVQQAYNQIQQYRGFLRDNSTGLWRHMAFGYSCDEGFWATGKVTKILHGIVSAHLCVRQATLGRRLESPASWPSSHPRHTAPSF